MEWSDLETLYVVLAIASALFALALPWALERAQPPARDALGLTEERAERIRRRL